MLLLCWPSTFQPNLFVPVLAPKLLTATLSKSLPLSHWCCPNPLNHDISLSFFVLSPLIIQSLVCCHLHCRPVHFYGTSCFHRSSFLWYLHMDATLWLRKDLGSYEVFVCTNWGPLYRHEDHLQPDCLLFCIKGILCPALTLKVAASFYLTVFCEDTGLEQASLNCNTCINWVRSSLTDTADMLIEMFTYITVDVWLLFHMWMRCWATAWLQFD